MIVIVGAAGEIGTYLTRRFAEENYKVIALDKRSSTELSNMEIRSFEIDFADEAAIDAVWQNLSLPKEVTLLNLIGCISTNSLFEVFSNWESRRFTSILRESFEENVFSVVSATMSFARFAFSTGLTPQIINFGSISSEGVSGQLAYGSAKGAIQSFSRVASVELGVFGIRVNCLVPGYVDSPKLIERISPERLSEVIGNSTIRKLVSLEDVFLATKYLHDSKTINGAQLEVHSFYGR
jgi:17beta-estradiol 17-dehydrogenase / 3alpha(17beta)-hydroxysteroid dehydrogenase (NAD+) / 3-oxoacyl-[acyl-carrier protein] reductase alpha subunit